MLSRTDNFKDMIIVNPYRFAQQIPRDGLIGEWLFEGNINETSGNNIATSEFGTVTYGTDRKGNANSALVGVDAANYVQLDADLNIGTVHTVSIWIYFNNLNGAMILNKWSTGCVFYFAPGPSFLTYRTSTGSLNVQLPNFNFSTGQWYHVLSERNGLNVKYTINNSIEGSGSLSINTDEIVRTLSKRYNNNDPDFYYLDGRLDDLKIYNRLLTAQEKTALYNE